MESFHKALGIRRDDTFSTTMLNNLIEQLMVDEPPFQGIFEMAAMPFPCNGLSFVVFILNIPTVLLMFFHKFASSIPFLIYFFILLWTA